MPETATVKEQGWSPSIPAAFIKQVKDKLKSNHYRTEETRCFCGADFNDTELARADRYHIPHRMVLCNECALMRANPRMTAESYNEFYQQEYRKIYDGWQFKENSVSEDYMFMAHGDAGLDFKRFIDYFNIKPKSILDIGCNTGYMLRPFMDEDVNIKVYGIEINHEQARYARKHGVAMFNSIEQATKMGLKVDLVIMNHIIEHLTDLREMEKIRHLLNDHGLLYVGTPGLYNKNQQMNLLFQNAHTYQFIATTLEYVMTSMGWECLYIDEQIDSIWVWNGGKTLGLKKPASHCLYIKEHLEQKEYRSLPPVRTMNKFSLAERENNINKNLGQLFPDISAIKKTESGDVVIVGGGPSVDNEFGKLKELVDKGYKLMVIERMYPWCKKVGLTPDYVVSLDGSDDVKQGFTDIQDSTVHLVGSNTNPEAVELLKGKKAYIFHGHTPYLKMQNLWHGNGYERATVINTGGSVVLACMTVSAYLGFRDLHVFGFDCMVTHDHTYARGISGVTVERNYYPVYIGDKEIMTCSAFLSFARQIFSFIKDADSCNMLDSLQCYGTCLAKEFIENINGNYLYNRKDKPDE